jgi:serine/threonine protein kinase
LIEDFLALAPASERRSLLIELIAIDLDRRHRRGEAVALSDYLAQFPELASDADAVATLAVSEYDLLQRKQPNLTPDDYVRRFPQFAEEVRRRLAAEDLWRTEAPPTRTGPASPTLQRLGDYELLEELGRGGMGIVYKARHVHLRKLVALKVLLPRWSAAPDVARRFQREVEAIGRVEHANLVRATDARELDGALFLVMELLEGEALSQRTRQQGPWPIAAACAVVRQVALGLQHAHEQGLVHRDLKPSNVFLTKTGEVKVLDLGLARLREDGGDGQELTAPGAFMGTPDFVAPEQIVDSRQADARADLYSLGCVLYYLLAGRAPFEDGRHTTINSKLEAHRSEPPPPLRTLRLEVPAELAAVLDRLLAKRPEDRYATAAEVAAALAPFAADSLVPSVPETRPPAPREVLASSIQATKPAVPPRRYTKLRRWGMAAGVVATVGLVLGWWWTHREPSAVEWQPLEGFIDVKVERADRGKNIVWKRFIDKESLPLRMGDKLRLVIEDVSRPVYLYVVWIDTTGEPLAYYPWIAGDWNKRPRDEKPVRGGLVLPLNGKVYTVDPGPTGMETILLLARDTPLPPSERLEERLAGLGPQQGLIPEEAFWFKDWVQSHYESRAANPRPREEASSAPDRLQGELRQRLGDLFQWSRSVCFGNIGGK